MVSVDARSFLVPSVLCLLVLAGCTGGSRTATVANGPLTAPTAEFDDTTGAITGTVLSTEFQPIPGAEVGIPSLAISAKTAINGGFTFSRLAPGEYTVQAVALGFNPGQQAVTVTAGKSSDGTDIKLDPIPIAKPRAHVEQFQGLVTCSIGTARLLSEECGAGVGTPVGRYGTNARNQIDWKFNLTTVDHLNEVYLELNWVPASAAAKMLGFNVAHGFKCEPDCAAKATYCDVFKNYGPPVMKCDVKVAKLQESIKDPAKDLPFDITARAWAAPTAATEQPTVVFEQVFTMYRTDFYDMDKPNDYTAVPAN